MDCTHVTWLVPFCAPRYCTCIFINNLRNGSKSDLHSWVAWSTELQRKPRNNMRLHRDLNMWPSQYWCNAQEQVKSTLDFFVGFLATALVASQLQRSRSLLFFIYSSVYDCHNIHIISIREIMTLCMALHIYCFWLFRIFRIWDIKLGIRFCSNKIAFTHKGVSPTHQMYSWK